MSLAHSPKPAPWSSGERGSRANNFDFIRLMMALGVIFSHAFPLVNGEHGPNPEGGEWLTQLTRGQLSLGSLSVHTFFIISGYLIAASWVHSRSFGDYLVKRVRRIYPGFLVAVLVSLGVALLGGAAADFSPFAILRRLIVTLTLQSLVYPTAFANNPIPGLVNGSMWTIQYEFYCYLVVALCGGWVVRRRGAFLVGTTIVLAALSAVILAKQWSFQPGRIAILTGWPHHWPRLLGHFLAGTVFYVYRDRIRHNAGWAVTAFATVLIASFTPPLLMFVSPFAWTYLLMWLAFHPGIRIHHFGKYGDFSYGVYLYAFPIQQYLIHVGVTPHVWQNIALAMPLSLVAGFLSWHLCEKHFLHFRRSGRRPDVLSSPAALTPAAE